MNNSKKLLFFLTLSLIIIFLSENAIYSSDLKKDTTNVTIIENDVQLEKVKKEDKIASAYYKKEKYGKAISIFKNIVKKYSKSLKPYMLSQINNNIGLCYANQGIYSKAKIFYKKAIKIYPKNPGPRINLSQTYISMGLYDKAIGMAKELLKIRENFADPYRLLGISYYHKGMLYESLKEWNKSLISKYGTKKDYAAAHNGLGYIYANSGEYQGARNEYQKTLKIIPDLEYALYGMGRLYYLEGRLDKALEYLEKVKTKKEIPPTYCLLAAVYKERGDKTELEKTIKNGNFCYCSWSDVCYRWIGRTFYSICNKNRG